MVRRDVNNVVLTGQVVNEPSIHLLKNSKKLLIFSFKVIEKFRLADGRPASHDNILIVEALGKHAETYYKELVVGERYQISGYLRSDKDKVRIRCYNIMPEN